MSSYGSGKFAMQVQYFLLISTKSARKHWSSGRAMDTYAWQRKLAKPAHFDRGFMNRIVKRELKFIPRGEKGSLQNFLRFSYNALRRKHLTLRKTRDETLKELVEKIEKAYPNFVPQYDKNYFKV